MAHSNAGKTSQQFRSILAPGQQVCLPVTGDTFYLSVVSGSAGIGIKTDYGAENIFYAGTGLQIKFDRAFNQLFLRNPNSVSSNVSIYFEIFIGFDGFIDNRVLLQQSQFSSIAVSVYDSNLATHPTIAIPDSSGTIITDTNGGSWFAVSREYVLISNTWSDAYTLLQNSANSVTIAGIPPRSVGQFPLAGAFAANFFNVDGGSRTYIGGTIVSIYACLPVL